MKFNGYKNSIKKIEKNKIKIISAALVLTTALTFAGCKAKTKEDSNVSIDKLSENLKNNGSEYDYILNLDYIKDCSLKESNTKIDLLKEIESESYNNYAIDGKADGFFYRYNYIILPSCYEHYNNYKKDGNFYKFSNINTKKELDFKKYEDLSGNEFVLVRSSIELTKKLSTNRTILLNGEKLLQKGDKLESTALIYNGEIIAFKQTGAGSECDNVVEIGDIDKALIKINSIIPKDNNDELKNSKQKLR